MPHNIHISEHPSGSSRHRSRRGLGIAVSTLLAATALTLTSAPAYALDVSVVSYGAVGDGTTNDRAAIQNAIDAVATAGGGTVTLPGGTPTIPEVYLSGDIELKSGVTLEIAANAVLKQSQNTAHYVHTPQLGREIPGGGLYMTYLDQNYPLIYAGNANNVHVTGDGTIELTRNGADRTSILTHGIGFHLVSDYSITDVTITGASAYNVTMRNTDHGEIAGVTTTSPATLNSDGISLMNSSFLSVHDNDLTTLDDGIYIWASYDDPRRSAWWNSDTMRPSHDIEIFNNVVNNQATNGSHGFLFINWTSAAPDKSQVEISRIDVHNNSFTATYPIGALNDDIYHAPDDKTPSKWLRLVDNTLAITPGATGTLSRNLDGMATADLETDDDVVYNFARASNTTGPYNSDFDAHNAWPTQTGLSFWSTEGVATSANGGPSGRYGEISGFDLGYSSLTQGVYLETGSYEVTVDTQSSGASIRLLAVRAGSPASVIASSTFSDTAWTPRTLSFVVNVAGNYRLGIDNDGAGGSASSWGRIDNLELTKTS